MENFINSSRVLRWYTHQKMLQNCGLFFLECMFPSQVKLDFLIVRQVTVEDQPSFKKEISLTWNSDDDKKWLFIIEWFVSP